MSAIKIENLKIGDVLQTYPDFSNVETHRDDYMSEDSVTVICTRPVKDGTTQKSALRIPRNIVSTKVMFISRPKRWVNVLNVCKVEEKENRVGWKYSIPVDLLFHTGERVIDTRKLPVLMTGGIPKYEKEAIYRRLRKPHKHGGYEMLQKNRLKWFLSEINKPFKTLMLDVIKVYNSPRYFPTCPVCQHSMPYDYIQEYSYTRASKVFIKCESCLTRLTFELGDLKTLHITNVPFKLVTV